MGIDKGGEEKGECSEIVKSGRVTVVISASEFWLLKTNDC